MADQCLLTIPESDNEEKMIDDDDSSYISSIDDFSIDEEKKIDKTKSKKVSEKIQKGFSKVSVTESEKIRKGQKKARKREKKEKEKERIKALEAEGIDKQMAKRNMASSQAMQSGGAGAVNSALFIQNTVQLRHLLILTCGVPGGYRYKSQR